jgi:uncharacterized protein with GYD domain
MARYLVRATYTAEGVRGLLKEGGTSRRETIKALIEKLGGSLESFHFAFGKEDAYVMVDLPDAASAAAVSLAVSASGAVRSEVVVLLTPEEIDEASRKTVDYRAPGA